MLLSDGGAWADKWTVNKDLYGAWMDRANGLLVGVGIQAVVAPATIDGSRVSNAYACSLYTGSTLNAAYGFGNGQYWAVGQDGTLATLNQGNMNCMVAQSPTRNTLTGVWVYDTGGNPGGGWAVGLDYTGGLLSLDGPTQKWSSVNSGISGRLTAVWGSSSTDVWFVGAGYMILHYAGMPK